MQKFAVSLFSIFLVVQTAFAQEKKMYIANHQVDCQGVGKMRCLQYRDSANEDWKNFHGRIEGFTYVPGYEYTLLVEMTTISNPPADGSSIRYTLKKIISKKASMVITEEDRKLIDNKKWILVEIMKGSDTIKPTNAKAFLQMDLNGNRFSGNAGCNSIFGKLVIDKNKIGFSGIGSTLMACMDDTVEKTFLDYMNKIDRFERKGFKLFFYQGKKLLMVFELLKQPRTA